MLDHLLDFEPPATSPSDVKPLEKAPLDEVVAAQITTAQWLEQMGAPNVDDAEMAAAQAAAQGADATSMDENADASATPEAAEGVKPPGDVVK